MANREVIEVNGKPVEIALKYASGRELSNDQGSYYMYTTTDERVLFATPGRNQRIQACNPYPGIRLTIQQMKDKTWDVRPLDPPAEQPRASTPVVTPAVQQAHYGQSNGTTKQDVGFRMSDVGQTRAPVPSLMTGQSQFIHAQLVAAIEAVHSAEIYAKAAGHEVHFTSEDIRAIAISCYIAQSKGGHY